jgi:hypothetical protein
LVDEHAELDVKRWLEAYNAKNPKHKKKYKLDLNTLMLIKFYIQQNCALTALKSQFLTYLLEKVGIKHPSSRTFKLLLDDALSKFKERVEEKLDSAHSIVLITDAWTNGKMEEYIALSVRTTNAIFGRETFTIDMMIIPGRNNAETNKLAIETMVNKFKFDKTKICGIVSDEGSPLVRLFKQVTNESLGIDNEDINDLLSFIYEEDEEEDED